jgi:hypothetical protein
MTKSVDDTVSDAFVEKTIGLGCWSNVMDANSGSMRSVFVWLVTLGPNHFIVPFAKAEPFDANVARRRNTISL